MKKQIKRLNKKTLAKFSFMLFIFTFIVASTLCAMNADIRDYVKSKVYEDRKVLSSATGYILHNNTRVKALKIMENNNLILEVYSNISYSDAPVLISRFPLEDLTKDAYFNFKGVSTNLAFDDVDQDGKLEVIVPGYNSHLTAKVAIYKFDNSNNEFIKSKDIFYN